MNPCIITAKFNAEHSSNATRNLMRFLRYQEAADLPIFIAELAYGEQEHILPDGDHILKLRTEVSNRMWHKENLLNLVEQIVPSEFDSLIWVDADVWFENKDWFKTTAAALDEYPVLQPYSNAIWTDSSGQIARVAASGAAQRGWPGHAGFAWAAHRSLWESIGLYEKAIIGGSDTIMMNAWVGKIGNNESDVYTEALAWQVAARDWLAHHDGSCGFIEGNLWHEWHGDRQHREYQARYERIRGLDIAQNVRRNEETGIMEFHELTPNCYKESIGEYFRDRREDGLLCIDT